MPKTRKKTKAELIDEKMAMVPEVTPAFEKWAMSFVDVHYMRYIPFRKNKNTIAVCSACGKSMTFARGEIRAGEDITCPKCKAECRTWRTDFIKRNPVENMSVSKEVILFQRVKNYFVERHFKAVKRIEKDKENMKLIEISRLFTFTTGMPHGRYFHLYNPWLGEEFWSDKNLCYGAVQILSGPVYPRTDTDRIFEDTRFKYCAMKELIKGKEEFCPLEWLSKYKKNPVEMELMAKAGLTRLALSLDSYDLRGSGKPWERLGITKQQIDQLRSFNGGYTALRWFQHENRMKGNADTDVVRYFEKERVFPTNVDFVRDRMSTRRIMNYMRRQKKATHMNSGEILRLWQDYLSMASRAKLDTNKELIYKPKNIKQAHDELVKLLGGKEIAIRAGEIEEKFPKVEEILSEIKDKYEFCDKDFMVKVPEKIEEIIIEGRKLGHCLDKSDIYFDRIHRRESFIVFLRRTEEPDRPFYTMEIEPGGTARQKRTTGDKQDESFKEAVRFIRKWQRTVKKRLNADDKKLADEAARLRAEEFRELREKQTKVWHGVLAGKLLVDVLEADLMEAG